MGKIQFVLINIVAVHFTLYVCIIIIHSSFDCISSVEHIKQFLKNILATFHIIKVNEDFQNY